MNAKLKKVLFVFVIVLLMFLAISSGLTKVTLMQQDVDFFGKYGFTPPILISYGALQILGGALLVFRQTRFAGAALIVLTFAISLVVLLLEGNIPVSIATVIAIMLLLLVMRHTRRKQHAAFSS